MNLKYRTTLGGTMDREQGQPESADGRPETNQQADSAGSVSAEGPAGTAADSASEGRPAESVPEGRPAGVPGFAAPGPAAPYPSYAGAQTPPSHNPYAGIPGGPQAPAYPPAPSHGPASGQGYGSGYPGYQGQSGYPGQFGQPGQSGYPGQPGYPGYGSYTPPPPTPGKGLAIAALVLAILALLICWIPLVNFVSFPLAAVAVGLGIPAMVKGLKGRNIAKPLSIAALSIAALSMVAAVVVNTVVVDSLRNAGLWEDDGPGTETGAESFAEFLEESEELSDAAQNDYAYEYSAGYIAEMVAEPANAAGDEVTVGDYTVTLVELDRDAEAEVLERDPSAGAPDHNYVIARFSAVYNGEGDGRPWLDLPAELVGTDNKIYSVMGCSMSLGMRTVDQELLSKGDTVTQEACFDVPDSALGEDSRLSMRMILAEQNNDEVFWRLP